MPGTLTHIPGGWAEFQAHRKDDGPPALANVSLTGTPFAFSDSILANNLNDFFCEVTSTGDSTGTGASVASDLSSFHLMAINSDPADASSGVSTREVADCADLGPASTFTTASWPLQYVSP